MRVPFKKQLQYIKNNIYLYSPAQKVAVSDNIVKYPLDLVTIAFNNEIVIDYQIKMIRKYLYDDYQYTVIDNSSDRDKQKRIENICVGNGVNYLLPPKNPFYGQLGSPSHGITLNWVYRNFIIPRQPQYFGFLDHDIFPVRPTSVLEKFIRSDLFGKIDIRDDKWYLWSGFCFFRFEFLKDKRIDFMPTPGLDTGGSNWYSIYSKINKESLPLLHVSCEKLRTGENKQTDMYEKIGDWIHTVNASEWVKAPHKTALVAELLDNYL